MSAKQLILALALQLLARVVIRADGPSAQELRRHPAAAVLFSGSDRLVVANERSGTLSLIDVVTGEVINETNAGRSVTDVVQIGISDLIAAVDFEGHEVLVARCLEKSIEVVSRTRVSRYPVSVSVLSGNRLAVNSQWSRRVTILRLEPIGGDNVRLLAEHVVDLPFAPRAQLPITPTHLLVAAAFGGQLAVINGATGAIDAVHNLPIHNIRGMAVVDRQVFFAHQFLHPRARTSFDDVHWGVLVENLVRWCDVDELLSQDGKVFDRRRELSLGEAGRAAGDPAGIAVTADRLFVAIAGMNQFMLVDRVGVRQIRIPVGIRPRGVVLDDPRQRAYVLNSLSDSVSLVDLEHAKVERTISLGSALDGSIRDSGEAAFYNARLSLDGWMSCHTCHSDGHSTDQLTDTLGDGEFGNRKRIPSLLGGGTTGPWAWNGSQPQLRDQINKSIQSTMLGPTPDEQTVSALAAYMESLRSAPSMRQARDDFDVGASVRGQKVFEQIGCSACHVPPRYTSPETYDVGLTDERGSKSFNPPSLLGASQRQRLFHDGSADSLETVIKRRHHQVPEDTPETDLADLLVFLESL